MLGPISTTLAQPINGGFDLIPGLLGDRFDFAVLGGFLDGTVVFGVVLSGSLAFVPLLAARVATSDVLDATVAIARVTGATVVTVPLVLDGEILINGASMSADDCIELVVGSDNTITLKNLVDKTNSDAAVTSATVRLITFQDKDTATPITGVTLPLSMAALAAPNDNWYRAVIPDGAGLTAGQRVDFEVEADDGADRLRVFRGTAVVIE